MHLSTLWGVHLCVVLISKVKVLSVLGLFLQLPGSRYGMLSGPDRSNAVLLCGSFMLFLYSFGYAFMRVCLLMPCGHLLGKG